MHRGRVPGRTLEEIWDSQPAAAFGVGEVRDAVVAHAAGEPQRLRASVLLLGGGDGRRRGLAGSLRGLELRVADLSCCRLTSGISPPLVGSGNAGTPWERMQVV